MTQAEKMELYLSTIPLINHTLVSMRKYSGTFNKHDINYLKYQKRMLRKIKR